jgi:hypothetical protein
VITTWRDCRRLGRAYTGFGLSSYATFACHFAALSEALAVVEQHPELLVRLGSAVLRAAVWVFPRLAALLSLSLPAASGWLPDLPQRRVLPAFSICLFSLPQVFPLMDPSLHLL